MRSKRSLTKSQMKSIRMAFRFPLTLEMARQSSSSAQKLQWSKMEWCLSRQLRFSTLITPLKLSRCSAKFLPTSLWRSFQRYNPKISPMLTLLKQLRWQMYRLQLSSTKIWSKCKKRLRASRQRSRIQSLWLTF